MSGKIVKFIDKLNDAIGIITGFATFLLLLMVLWGVFARYVLRSPSHIALEISGYFMVLLSFLGAGYILLKEKHVSVQVLTVKIPEKYKKLHQLSVNIILALFSFLIIYEGISFTILSYTENYRSTSLLNFPLWIVFATIPFGTFFFFLQTIRNILKTFTDNKDY
jgi:TRAP-type C4-dicarboxylate transport system permease small subunit